MKKLLSAFVITALAMAPSYSAIAAPAAAPSDASPAPQQEKLSADIQKTAVLLSDAQANQIATDMKNRILEEYGQKYNFENFKIEFSDEEDKGEVVGIDVSVNADMILTQDPAQSAYVKGMQQSLSELADPAQKAAAQEEIDRFLSEAETYYNQPSNSWFLYHVDVPKNQEQGFANRQASSSGEPGSGYRLFSREDITSDETILTPLGAAKTLDDSAAKQEGMETVEEAAAEASQQSIAASAAAVSYSRTAARDYALSHAFEAPEFSKQNGMGSDCANFVSKAINKGGIPIEKSRNWHPSPSKGSYAGDNWMRTGYYNNGGVVPYMVNKGYFKNANKSSVGAGSILSRKDTSHVALVTYGDGSTIKYTEHSDYKVTKKDIVYTGSNAAFYVPN